MDKALEPSLKQYLVERDRFEAMGGMVNTYDPNDKTRLGATRDAYRPLPYNVSLDDLGVYYADRDRREREGGPLMYGRVYDRRSECPLMDVDQGGGREGSSESSAGNGDVGGSHVSIIEEWPQDIVVEQPQANVVVERPQHVAVERPQHDVVRRPKGIAAKKPWEAQIIKWRVEDASSNLSSSTANGQPPELDRQCSPHTGKRGLSW